MLIAVGQRRRTPDRDEAMVERMMAGIAAGTEIVESGRESGAVLAVDRLLQSGKRRADMLVDDVVAEQLGDIVKTFLQFADLVIRQRPVAGVTGEPELDVAHLLQRHEFAEAGLIGLGLRPLPPVPAAQIFPAHCAVSMPNIAAAPISATIVLINFLFARGAFSSSAASAFRRMLSDRPSWQA